MSSSEPTLADPGTTQLADADSTQVDPGSPSTRPPTTRAGEPQDPAALGRIGRYLVVEMLGEGGMGVVYRAYDPELDRQVAIKLLRGQTNPNAAARLQREAQAMAKLSHQNVVQVYDAGTFAGQVFVAMAYVPGTTLTSWLEQQPRAWREIVDVFVAAGRGLAAAHAQALVHRDFKPDNVLVCEPRDASQERLVQVLDFGLAKGVASEEVREPSVADRSAPTDALVTIEAQPGRGTLESRPGSQLDVQLTREGAVMGTPAYMSPEQHRGEPTDARTDQFSFCVALYEALWGRRPFAGDDYYTIAYSVLNHQLLPPPPDSKVPARLWPLLARGLDGQPDKRWPDLASLLAALADDPAQRRRSYALVGAVGLAFAATVGWALTREPEPTASVEPPPRCQGAADELAKVWNQPRAQAIAQTFAARSDGWADDVAQEVQRRLDAWAEQWVAERTQACEATEVRGEQSAELMDLRIACYDEQLAALAPVVDLLASADDQVARKAVDVVDALPSFASCDDAEALRAVVAPADPALAAQAAELRTKLTVLRSQASAGRLTSVVEQSKSLLEDVERLGYAPLIYQVMYAHGEWLDAAGTPEQARPFLEQALRGALAVRDDKTAARALNKLLVADGYATSNYDGGLAWARLIELVLARDSDPSSEARGNFHRALAMVELQAKHYETAREQANIALELDRRRLGEHRQLGMSLDVIGSVELMTGNYEAARAAFARSLELREAAVGRNHPDLASPLNNLALAHERLAQFDQAAALAERVLALIIATQGATHPNVGLVENNLGGVLLLAGKVDLALPHLRRGVEIVEQALGPDHQLVGRTLTMRGDGELAAGEHEQALTTYERALAIRRAALGDEHGDLALSHLGVGNALLALERPAKAVPSLERAVELLSRDGGDPIDRGLARFSLARGLAKIGEPRRVAELVELARKDFAAGGVRAAADLRELEAWVATLP